MKHRNQPFIIKGWWFFYGLVALLPLYYCIGFGWLFLKILDPFNVQPTEQAMVENFNSHRADFEQLRLMKAAHPRFRCDTEKDRQDDTMPLCPPAYFDLRDKLQVLHLSMESFVIDETQGTWFTSWTTSSIMSGTEKGYVYTLHPAGRVVDHIDGTATKDLEIIYQHLDGNWYLYEADL